MYTARYTDALHSAAAVPRYGTTATTFSLLAVVHTRQTKILSYSSVCGLPCYGLPCGCPRGTRIHGRFEVFFVVKVGTAMCGVLTTVLMCATLLLYSCNN